MIARLMSPTILKYKNYRFFFFSREESRIHVHVTSPDGEAKFWLEPIVSLADFYGLNSKQLNDVKKIVEKNQNEIKKAWKKFFSN